jgi:hypothetical protein
LIGSQESSLGSVPTSSEDVDDDANTPGPFAACRDFSFGHGVPGTDDVLPNNPEASSAFWITADTDSDHAQVDQAHEWELGGAGSYLAIDVRVYLATLLDTGTPTVCKLEVTINGVATGVIVNVLDGFTGRLQANAAVAFVDGDTVGLKWLPDANFNGGFLRVTATVCATHLAPTPIPPPAVIPGLGLVAGWETDPLVSTTTKDAVTNRISEVTDGFGGGFDQVQATGARQPLWVPAVFNAYGGIQFGAAMDRILEYSASNLGLVDGQARTIMAVCKPTGAAGGSLVVFKRATNYFGLELWKTGGNQFFYGNGQFPTPVDIKATIPVDYGGNRIVVIWDWNGTIMKCRVNAVPIPLTTTVIGDETSVAPGVTLGNNNGVFGDRGFIGEMAGAWIWDRSLAATPGDTELAETYAGKYL